MFTVKNTITMLPDLAQLNIGDCLIEPFRLKREGLQYLATKLRGRDAVFWKEQSGNVPNIDDYEFSKYDIIDIIEDNKKDSNPLKIRTMPKLSKKFPKAE